MPSSPSVRLAEQPAPTGEQKNPYLRVHAVNIFVHDQERSLRFYLDQLGFDLAFDVRMESGDRWVAVSPPDGTGVLMLVAPAPESEEYKLIGRPTGVSFVTDDVAATYGQWRKRGVRFAHTPRLRRVKYQKTEENSEGPSMLGKQAPVWGGVFTRFQDIDHNWFGLFSFDELTEGVERQRREAAEKAEQERRAAHELEIAKQVQARLFPQRLPPLRTLDYAGLCIQASQVGGDYYDFLDLGQERLGLVLGDISGKGIAAALLMANLQANLRSQCTTALDELERLLSCVNQLFYDNTAANAYASLFFGMYDDATQCLRYANCGHLSALLLRDDGGLQHLNSTCTVMGLFKDWECTVAECRLMAGDRLALYSDGCRLVPGDRLALYSDGITESFNAPGEEFGEERLIQALRRHGELPSQDLLQAIVSEVQRFSLQGNTTTSR